MGTYVGSMHLLTLVIINGAVSPFIPFVGRLSPSKPTPDLLSIPQRYLPSYSSSPSVYHRLIPSWRGRILDFGLDQDGHSPLTPYLHTQTSRYRLLLCRNSRTYRPWFHRYTFGERCSAILWQAPKDFTPRICWPKQLKTAPHLQLLLCYRYHYHVRQCHHQYDSHP